MCSHYQCDCTKHFNECFGSLRHTEYNCCFITRTQNASTVLGGGKQERIPDCVRALMTASRKGEQKGQKLEDVHCTLSS